MERVLLQRDLNELMTGDTFDLTMKYSRLMGVIFICFIYSSGMPFLLFVATFTLLTQYLTDKYLSKKIIFFFIIIYFIHYFLFLLSFETLQKTNRL